MINNRQGNRRRGRGGQQPRGVTGNNGGGNRQDNRQRGNAAQLLEKYKSMARDAQQAGDRVQTEYYLQFADHYFRMLGDARPRFDEQKRQRDDDDQDYDGDDRMDSESDNDDGDNDADLDNETEDQPQRQQQGRGRPASDRAEPRRERFANDRSGNDRTNNDRSSNERSSNDRSSNERSGGERSISDRANTRTEHVRADNDRVSSERVTPRRDRPNARVTVDGNRNRDENGGGRDDDDGQRIDFAVLPPAIPSGSDDSDSDREPIPSVADGVEDAPKPRRRVRRPRAEEGDATAS